MANYKKILGKDARLNVKEEWCVTSLAANISALGEAYGLRSTVAFYLPSMLVKFHTLV